MTDVLALAQLVSQTTALRLGLLVLVAGRLRVTGTGLALIARMRGAA